MRYAIALGCFLALCLGCASFTAYDPTRTDAEGEPLIVLDGGFGGRGRMIVTLDEEGKLKTVKVEQDGASEKLTDAIKTLFSRAASVFGGSGEPVVITVPTVSSTAPDTLYRAQPVEGE